MTPDPTREPTTPHSPRRHAPRHKGRPPLHSPEKTTWPVRARAGESPPRPAQAQEAVRASATSATPVPGQCGKQPYKTNPNNAADPKPNPLIADKINNNADSESHLR